jgi:hypothetical protein
MTLQSMTRLRLNKECHISIRKGENMATLSLDQMEAKLREAWDGKFDGLYQEKLSEYGNRRGALNEMRTKESEASLNPALFVSAFPRRSTRGETKGQVTQVSFRVLQPDGRPSLVIAARDSLSWIKSSFPNITGKLVPISLSPVMKREDVISGATTYFVIPDKTALALLADTGQLDFTVNVYPIQKAIDREQAYEDSSPSKTSRRPFSVVYGNITDVRVFADKETGELRSVKATLEDLDGTMITTRLEKNLEEVLGSQEWIDEPDAEKIRNSLIDMPVLVGGTVFIGHEGDELTNAVTKEVSVLEADVTSFVVKGGGYIVNLETASPSVYAAVMKALDQNGKES